MLNTKTTIDQKFREIQAIRENEILDAEADADAEFSLESVPAQLGGSNSNSNNNSSYHRGHRYRHGNNSYTRRRHGVRNIMGRSVYDVMETAFSLRNISDIFPNDDILFFFIWCVSIGIHAAVDMLLAYHTYLLFSGQTTLEHYSNADAIEWYK